MEFKTVKIETLEIGEVVAINHFPYENEKDIQVECFINGDKDNEIGAHISIYFTIGKLEDAIIELFLRYGGEESKYILSEEEKALAIEIGKSKLLEIQAEGKEEY